MITLALFLVLARAPAPQGADDNPHFARAVAAWKDRRWPDAADAFARAYELDPRPQYVFARAQALRFAGECELAIVHYREFIALAPPQAAIDEARGHIATCGGQPDEGATTSEPTPPAPRVEPTPTVVAPVVEPPPRRLWWRDPAGHALGWSGLAIAAVGAGLLGEGLARRERGERANDEQSYRDARQGGKTLLYAGIPLASIGGALVLASVIRFAVIGGARGKRRLDPRVGARRD